MVTEFLKFTLIFCSLFGSFSPAFCDSFEAGMRAMERKHYATAMRAWLRLAKDGVPQAENNVGHLYEEGYGVSQNYTKAMEWYRKAAQKKLPEAQHNVGMLYAQGYGVEKNDREAFKWFKKAADQELQDAQYMVGLAYYQGKGVKLSFSNAKKYFKQSANKGFGEAQFMYSYMLQAGEAAEKPDSYKAFIWGSLAQKNGIKTAEDVVNTAKLFLDESQILAALSAVTSCLKTSYRKCPF